jgi:hypothetical protein
MTVSAAFAASPPWPCSQRVKDDNVDNAINESFTD